MPKRPSKDNPKCPICSNIAVRNGIRKIKQRSYQRYLCKVCNHPFSTQPKPQASKSYNLKTILNTISNYNLGRSLRQLGIPKSTIHLSPIRLIILSQIRLVIFPKVNP